MKTKIYFKKAILLVLVCTAQFITAQVPNYVPTTGLVGYWPFNGNANDASGNANNGTNNGATLTTDRLGNVNSAYSFNGSSNYINVNSSSSLNTANMNQLSISGWFNNISSGSGGGFVVRLGNQNLTTGGIGYEVYTNAGNLNVNNWWLNQNPHYSDSKPIQNNQWYFFVIVYDFVNNVSSFYVNGTLVNSTTATLYKSTNPILNIGRNTNIGSYFNGLIDDIGIWNRALTQTEITTMYNGFLYSDNCNAVSGSLVNGLVAYYPFCGNANDQSGHGYDGTVNGATLTTDRFGNTNAAYSFDGTSNYIQLPNNSSITPANITVSLWAKILSNKVNQRLIRQRASGFDVSYNMQAQYGATATNKLSSDLYTSSTINYNPIINNVVNDQQWHQIIFSYDGLNFKIYIDSLLAYQNNSNGAGSIYYNNSGNGFTIGRDGDNADWYLNGIIDDVGIWNRALTTSEVTQLYNQNQCFTNTTVTDTLVINVGQMGFNPVTYANNITIYPNPASTLVNISFNTIADLSGGTIKIINALGQQVATTPITATGTNTTMTLSTWGGAGLYFVQIVNPQGQIVDIKKILLQ